MSFYHKNNFRWLFRIVGLIVIVNIISNYRYLRVDLTEDSRYTFSEVTEGILNDLDQELFVSVLLEGSLPPEYRRLQEETKQLLQEFADINSLLKFNFINPLKKEDNDNQVLKSLVSMGVMPLTITIKEGYSISQRMLFPWALVSYKGRTIRVSLMKNSPGMSDEQKVNISVQQLEYAFSTAMKKLLTDKKKTVAIIKGNAEIEDIYIADFLRGLRESYVIAPFTLDSVARKPQETLNQLSEYDLAILAKPTEPFSDEEKQVLDQYVMRGGRMLMLMDEVHADLDSLINSKTYFAFPGHLNLEDMLFKYGVRINPVLVKDMMCTDITLAQDRGSSSVYHTVPWLYAPQVVSEENHIINRNIKPVKLSFTNTIDTIYNDIKKTILLRSSERSKAVNTPIQIALKQTMKKRSDKYIDAHLPFSVLLEGRFTSVYKNRVKPIKLDNYVKKSPYNKIIVVADGDIVKNQVLEGKPLELGFDKWTNKFYGNKDFLMNCANYLLDDIEFISVRTKKIDIPLLDKEKIYQERYKWRILNLLIPILPVGIFWIVYGFLRHRRYSC